MMSPEVPIDLNAAKDILRRFENLSGVWHPILLRQFVTIALLSEQQLTTLGLTTKIRDTYFSNLILPSGTGEDALNACWGWRGTTVSDPPRGIIYGFGTNLYIYRVSFILFSGRPISEGLCIRHRCPGGPKPICSNSRHLLEGTDGQNMQDREDDGHNGAKLYPERILRGLDHPGSVFSFAEIQKIKSTYFSAPEKFGLISGLARHTGHHRATISRAVWGFPEIPIDEATAIDLSLLDVRRPHDRKGDANGRSTMPEGAIELFYGLYHRSSSNEGRSRLLSFAVARYGISASHLIRINSGKFREGIAQKMNPIIANQPLVEITDDLLEVLFKPHPRLR